MLLGGGAAAGGQAKRAGAAGSGGGRRAEPGNLTPLEITREPREPRRAHGRCPARAAVRAGGGGWVGGVMQ